MTPAAPPPGAVPDEDLGLAHGAGGSHYRAYVGPPEHYDVIAAMTFNLLTTIGLRQEHTLLDVGCGSLRSGRLFIPYLNRGGYFGLEPNGWLVEEGVRREVGRDLVAMKRPRFVIANRADALPADARFDFAVAQSIFSHTGTDLLTAWLDGIARRLKPGGALAATYLPGASDPVESGWIYPGCVQLRPATLESAATDVGLEFVPIHWAHPRQSWALFATPEFDLPGVDSESLGWNRGAVAREWANRG